MTNDTLLMTGWKPFFEQQIAARESDAITVARVSSHHSSQVILLGEDGEFSIPVQSAEAVGGIAVGDWLVLDANADVALQRLERQTVLLRRASGEVAKPQVIAANIDTLFITTSCNEEFNLSRIERYLALALGAGIRPVVVLTKADVCDAAVEYRRQTEQLHPGLVVESLDARDPEQASHLRVWCGPGQSVALLGSSGVGKSTLANALGAGDLDTGSIREADAKGRHTTTARSLHLLPSGGVLVDNPGVRECQLPDCGHGLNALFDDVIQIAERCRFRNCSHEGEAGCAIGLALESGELDARRFANCMKLHAEQTLNSRALVERQDGKRTTGRMDKVAAAGKRRRPGQ